MRSYKFVVMTNAVDGQDEEFNRWYSETHLPDLLKIPGVVAAQRFQLSQVQRSNAPMPYRYMAIYDIVTDDLKAVADEIGRRSGTEAMILSDAMDVEKISSIFEPLAPAPQRVSSSLDDR